MYVLCPCCSTESESSKHNMFQTDSLIFLCDVNEFDWRAAFVANGLSVKRGFLGALEEEDISGVWRQHEVFV